MRTLTKHEDDVLPVIGVWIPTGVATYFVVFKLAEWLLLSLGYSNKMPVELVGGGESTTVQMVAASYYAGPIGIAAMLLVIGAWYYRDRRNENASS